MSITFPKKLNALRQAVVQYQQGSRKRSPNLKPLEDWLENEEGWDEVVMSVLGAGIFLETVAEKYFSNSTLRDHVEIKPGARITKAQKLAYVRDCLAYEFRVSDNSLHAVEINDDPKIYLACFILGQGLGGWVVEWLGAYKTVEELITLDDGVAGFFISQQQISDEKILSMWTR